MVPVIAGLSLLGGCSDERSATGHEVTVPSSVAALTPEDLATLSENYWTFERWREDAQNAIVARCVKDAKGPQFEAPLVVADTRAEHVVDRTYRATNGYNVWRTNSISNSLHGEAEAALAEILLGDDPSKRQSVRLPHDYELTVPEEGCYAEARKLLGGSITAWAEVEYLPNYLNLRLQERVARAPEIERHLARWATCMSAKGYRASAPAKFQRAFQTSYPNLPPGVPSTQDFKASEIRAALADSDCQEASGYASFVVKEGREAAAAMPSNERVAAQTAIRTMSQAPHRIEQMQDQN